MRGGGYTHRRNQMVTIPAAVRIRSGRPSAGLWHERACFTCCCCSLAPESYRYYNK